MRSSAFHGIYLQTESV